MKWAKYKYSSTANLSEGKYERLCNMVFSCIPSSLLIFDHNLRVLIANKNFLEKSRRTEDETIGRHVTDIFPSVILQYTKLTERIRKVFESGIGDKGREMNYRAPGLPSRVYFYNLTPLIDDTGAVESVLLIMDDITQQVALREKVLQTERHLVSLVESANDIVASLDSNGLVKTWNSAAERITDYGEGELIGKPLASIFPEGQRNTLLSIIKSLSSHERAVKHIELGLTTKPGKVIPISWSFAQIRDDTQSVIGIVGVGQDFTERRELEAQLFQSDKLASLGIMAGGIAHQIRNPLGISSAAAQILLERPENENLRKECAEKIYLGINRASKIIEELLKFVRPSEGRFEMTNVNNTINDTLTLVEKQIVVMRVEINKFFRKDMPLIKAEGSLLKQAFLNMILNAANAMPDGGTLSISTDVENDYILVIFKDTGYGISTENARKVFDPFFTTMPVGKGTGLGLSITYSIIKQHEGIINVNSAVGKGTTFTIRLPLKKHGT